MKDEDVYKHLWAAHDADADLDRSFAPRSPDLLFEIALDLGLADSWVVLDVGCGRGNHACELASRFRCRVKGLEPVESNLLLCKKLARETNVLNQVEWIQGSIEAIPFESEQFDLIWCRDMLVHIQELERGLRECRRVLKPGGFLLILTTFATQAMEPEEENMLCRSLNLSPASLSQKHMEQCFNEAGFQVISAQWLGSELAEFYEERDGRYSTQMKRIARMTRENDKFKLQMGQDKFDVSLALYRWGVYQMIGKLGLMIYTLQKSSA